MGTGTLQVTDSVMRRGDLPQRYTSTLTRSTPVISRGSPHKVAHPPKVLLGAFAPERAEVMLSLM